MVARRTLLTGAGAAAVAGALLPSGAARADATIDAAAKRLIIVAVNTDAAQTYTFDLSAFTTVTGGVTRWTTVPAGSDRYTQRSDVSLSGKTIKLAVPAASVQTPQIDGVTA